LFQLLTVNPEESYFWGTHNGAEIDLVIGALDLIIINHYD